MKEVWQVRNSPVLECYASACLVYGSWSKKAREEGFECSLLEESESDVSVSCCSEADDVKNHDLESEEQSKLKQQPQRPLKGLRSLLSRRTKRRGSLDDKKNSKSVSEAASVASTASESTATSICSNLEGSIIVIPISDEETGHEISVHEEDPTTHDVPPIQTRLFESGIVKSTRDYEFVIDRVSKEVMVDPFYAEEKNDDEENVTHVKTGIWEVTCFDNHGKPLKPFYIVTGVSMDDSVDTKKLRKAVFAGHCYKRRPRLSMAPREIAEDLAGFRSGTMAPICHSVDMKLYLEESLIADVDVDHKLNVGSGMFGKCLSITVDKFLQIANQNPEGMEVCSLIQKTRPSSNNLHEKKCFLSMIATKASF
jgi:hypothetical protein